jgi:two-component system sensor histidine kinase YesM
VREEFEHVESYLVIQRMRYRDILDYAIQLEEGIGECRILKLTLQPLVENAIYHGIKNKRAGGRVQVSGRRLDGQRLEFRVADDGCGFSPERLVQVRGALAAEGWKPTGTAASAAERTGIQLYYGKAGALSIDSRAGRCIVTVSLLGGAMTK